MPVYITDTDYQIVTGRDKAEATVPRCKVATQLLDSRIGPRERGEDGLKLDLDKLPSHQVDAVKTWCAWMIAYLVDNGDRAPTTETITLGRFSVTEHGQRDAVIPEEMDFADGILRTSGLVNRLARIR